MRLFYALLFTDETIDWLIRVRDQAANHALKGRFVKPEHMHLTLEFLGEKKDHDLPGLIDILDTLPAAPASLTSDGYDSFKGREGHTLYLAVKKSAKLKNLHKILTQELILEEHNVEKRRYQPHITLGRQVHLDQELSTLAHPKGSLQVKSVALMQSKQDASGLHYIALAEVPVAKQD